MELEKVHHIHISSDKITIEKKNIYYQLGYKNIDPDEHTANLTNEYIIKCLPLIQAQGELVYLKIKEINKKQGKLSIQNIEFNIDRIIASQLYHSEYIALYAGTIGESVEKLSTKLLSRGDSIEGYIVSLIGSEAAEGVANYLHAYIGEFVKKNNLFITNRFSPGYCGWNVEEQFKLFSFLPNNSIGISLTNSALMHPLKSISGIVGVGKNVKLKPYACSKCKTEDCLYRKLSH